MPDPALIHGRAIPAAELPIGTITVRVVREAMGNNVAGQDVRLTVGGSPRSAKTDDQGRAEFTNLTPGADVRAEANVNGEPLVSETFKVPASGGLRVILVAGLKDAAARKEKEAAEAAAAPAVPGVVVLGPNSRTVLQFNDDALQVFYVLDIVNNARTRVDIGGPLIIDLPRGAGGAAILEGSSPAATVSGDRVTVTGPFAPGNTSIRPHHVPDLADSGAAADRCHGKSGLGVDVVAAVFHRRRGERRDGRPVPAGERAGRRPRRHRHHSALEPACAQSGAALRSARPGCGDHGVWRLDGLWPPDHDQGPTAAARGAQGRLARKAGPPRVATPRGRRGR